MDTVHGNSCSSELRLLDTYNAEGHHSCTTCKKTIHIQLLINDDEVIVDAGGMAEGCGYSKACLTTLVNMVKGMSIYDAYPLTNEDLCAQLSTVKAKYDCDVFTVGALKIALRDWEKKHAA
uniref:NIF system FeS cluster assembly NifU N-terminal domain-containing protein n=1 Tax=Fundidesulfovibrio putealis TaxID=270496 RepID=A0A7C4AG37_9BACT